MDIDELTSLTAHIQKVAGELTRLTKDVNILSATEVAILFTLSRGPPLAVTELAKRVGSDKSHTSRSLAKLARRGFADYSYLSEQRISKFFSLTKLGRDFLLDLDANSHASMKALAMSLNNEQKMAFNKLSDFFVRSSS